VANHSVRSVYSPKDGLVLSHYGEILRQLVIERGGDSQQLLEGTGIRLSVLTGSEGRLSYEQFIALVRNAMKVLDDPSLGLHFGLRLSPMTHGSLGQAIMCASNVQQAVDIMMKYYKTRFAPIAYSHFVEDGHAVIQLDEYINLGDLKPFLVDALFVSIIEFGRFLFGPSIFLDGLCRLSYPCPAHAEVYRQLFHGPVEFGCPSNQLRFAAAHLMLPMAMANPVARHMAEQQCEAQLKAVEDKDSIVAKVRAIMAEGEDEIPTMEDVAARLFMTSRTLRRQLQAFSTSYQDILADMRCKLALRMLESTNKPIDEIAHQLGYSDPSNFGRAFRKWTGRAPSDFRRI
jgi:AraC-like DNA-binding protein